MKFGISIKKIALMMAVSTMLAACGSAPDNAGTTTDPYANTTTTTTGGTTGTTTTGGTTTATTVTSIGSFTLTPLPASASAVADGTSTIELIANVKDVYGSPITGQVVVFTDVYGSAAQISSGGNVTTDNTGTAKVTVVDPVAESVTIKATVGTQALTQPLIFTTITATGTTTTGNITPTQLSLAAFPVNVKSDNSDISTITATVLDASNAVVPGVTVLFSTTGGQISAASAVTDANGNATITFSAGASKVNQVSTITASIQGSNPVITSQIPVQSVGSTVNLTSSKSNITATTTDTLTITVTDAAGTPIYNLPISLSQSGAGSVSFSPTAPTTDINGQAQVTVTGVTSGAATVTVSAAGATATQGYTVTIAGVAFAITAPTQNPASAQTNTATTVSVSVPTGIANVTFASSLGTWNGTTNTVVTVPVTAGAATATLTSTQAGIANIQVYDAANINTSDTLSIAFSQPASQASNITLQSNVNVVAPSTGGVTNTATLTATVTDVNGAAVGGASVAFSIPAPTGGGESLSPVVGLTDAQGKVTTIFSSGSVSTGGQGVNITASVVSATATPVTPATTNIVIGGTAGSVAISKASKVVVRSTTEYALPMAVLVADGNGNAVANATVTLKAFPSQFATGHWVDADPDPAKVKFFPCQTGVFVNEDTNKNTILDPGEDVPHVTLASSCDIYGAATGAGITYPTNGRLDVGNSYAGALPATVTTDVNGVAQFELVYLKTSAAWVADTVTASVPVLGTETTSSITFWLPYEKTEGESGFLPASVFAR